MPDNTTNFVQQQLKAFANRRYEVFGAQITDAIRLTVKVSRSLIPGSRTPADMALYVANTVASDGWRFTGFSYDEAGVIVDLIHPLIPE